MSPLACLLVTGLSLLAHPASAQTSRIEATQAQTIDLVRTVILETPSLTVFDDVRATVGAGIVTLTGKVTAPSKRESVRRSVLAIAGVREIQDLIVVLPASPSDDALRDRIARAIYGDARFWRYAMMSRPPIRIIVEDGGVTLTGSVGNAGDRALARALAMQSGATSVRDGFQE